MQLTNQNTSTRKSSFQLMIGWILCFLFLGSCGRLTPVAYSDFINVNEDGLQQNWSYTFNPIPFDSTEIINGRFDVSILVRYVNTCVSKSVIFDVESLSLAHPQPDSTRVEIQLFDNDGLPWGKGNFGVLEVSQILATNIQVAEGYTISLTTPLPQEDTKGIIDIGIKLVRTGKKEFDLPTLLHLKETFLTPKTHKP